MLFALLLLALLAAFVMVISRMRQQASTIVIEQSLRDERVREQQKRDEERRSRAFYDALVRGPAICLGRSGGILKSRNHICTIPRDEPVILDLEQASKGIAVIGPSGSGKTRAVLQPAMRHWLLNKSAGLFTVAEKPNWASIVARIAAQHRPAGKIHIVGPGKKAWPLIRGLEPDGVGNFVETAGAGGTNPYFPRQAGDLTRHIASVLKGITTPFRVDVRDNDNKKVLEELTFTYSLQSIHRIAMMPGAKYRKFVLPAFLEAAASLSDLEMVAFIETQANEVDRMLNMDSGSQREGIVGTVDSVLSPFFADPAFCKAFSGEGDFDLACLDEGDVVILDIDKNKYKRAFRSAFLLAFERLVVHMDARTARLKDGKDSQDVLNGILFVCDEYASVAAEPHKS